MKTERSFIRTSRYHFDSKLTASKGWAQLDSDQDASYYGQWTNPFTLQTFSYAEGDTTMVTYESEQEYVEKLAEHQEWDLEYTGKTGIDPAFNEELKARFAELGISTEYRKLTPA